MTGHRSTLRDLRDPQKLGEYLLWCRNNPSFNAPSLSAAYDAHAPGFWEEGGPFKQPDGRITQLVPNYDANPGPLEKYGCPLDLPEG